MEPSGPPRARMGISTRQQTATPTRTPGAVGRARGPQMLHTVGEAAVDRTITAAIHPLHSAAGAAILVATPGGGPGLRAPRVGAVEAVVVVGVVEAVVVGAVVVSSERESKANGGVKCSTYSAIVTFYDRVSNCWW